LFDSDTEYSDEDVEVEYTYLNNDEVELNVVEEPMLVNPHDFTTTYYGFTKESYTYMIRCLKNECKASDDIVISVDPTFLNVEKSVHEMKSNALKKLLTLERSVGLRKMDNGDEPLYNKSPTVSHFVIAHIEEWEGLIKGAHESRIKYYKPRKIVDILRGQGWLVFGKQYGISIQYIEEFCKTCRQCLQYSPPTSTSSQKQKLHNQYDEAYKLPLKEFPELQKALLTKHMVHLKLQRKYNCQQ
jgi:hypothetical protein